MRSACVIGMKIAGSADDAEPTMSIRNHDSIFVILLLFVDDILLTGTDQGIEDYVKEYTD
jgi:hypothetical protein